MTAAPEVKSARFDPEPGRFRQVLGHFCTGVTVVTTADDDGPAGLRAGRSRPYRSNRRWCCSARAARR
jgi:hypothetical protein